MSSTSQQLTQFSGCVSTVIFSNPESNYAVLLLRQHQADQVITGQLSDCDIGDYITVSGEWVTHPVHKKQFKVLEYTHLVPRTTEELTVFLSSGAIKGVGVHFAKQLMAIFGDQLVPILDNTPNALLSVPGIGKKKLTSIIESWKEHRSQLSFLQYLLQFKVDIKLAKRIWRQYFSESLAICQQNPYQLIGVVQGVTFELADNIGRSSQGLRLSNPRISAAIHDVFVGYYQTSNVWMPFDQFIQQFNQRLQLDNRQIVEDLIQERLLAQDLASVTDKQGKQWVALSEHSYCECRIMDIIDQLMASHPRIIIQEKKAVEWALPRSQHQLTEDQVSALIGLCSNTVSILYGGPGSGKTSLLKAYVDIMSKKTKRIVCMAPTGKAAKRLSSQINWRASTIHSMMEFDEKQQRLVPSPLNCDVCIIDEMSMVDMMLFLDTLQMINPGVRLVMVGDQNQLPSIGIGQVFKDMITRSKIPAFQLTTNHRQVTHKGITTLSDYILLRTPITPNLGDDLTFLHMTDQEAMSQKIQDLVLNQIPSIHKVAIDDVQVLAPIHKGPFGIHELNQQLSRQLRPAGFDDQRWVVGDRVIQCRNNYTKKVMNGDIGSITFINQEKILVQFESQLVSFEPIEMHDCQLAYAVSIHKFQGSEIPIVVMPIMSHWRFFMTMDVLYTAVTRAKDHLYIIGDMHCFNSMIEHSKKTERLTQLFS